jgi:putative ATP-dependent endonuclease of OLD family
LRNLKIPIEQQKTLRDELENLNNHLLSADSRIEQVQLSLEKIQDVMPYEIGEKTSIQALPMKPWELLSRARVVIQGHGHNVDFPLNRHGQGIQSLAVIFLFEAYINVFLKPQFEPETKSIIRLLISSAALFVKVRHNKRNLLPSLKLRIRAIRQVRTLVFPEPGPASNK